MPWGVGWVLGGGNKKKALAVMQEAIDARDDFYANAEALFGLWDMQVREKNYEAALVPARRLAELFPENLDVAKFLATRNQATAR
jgi:Flp pilus assembly protein TadD